MTVSLDEEMNVSYLPYIDHRVQYKGSSLYPQFRGLS